MQQFPPWRLLITKFIPYIVFLHLIHLHRQLLCQFMTPNLSSGLVGHDMGVGSEWYQSRFEMSPPHSCLTSRRQSWEVKGGFTTRLDFGVRDCGGVVKREKTWGCTNMHRSLMALISAVRTQSARYSPQKISAGCPWASWRVNVRLRPCTDFKHDLQPCVGGGSSSSTFVNSKCKSRLSIYRVWCNVPVWADIENIVSMIV